MRHWLGWLGSLLRWGFYGAVVFCICVYGFLLIFAWHAEQRETLAAQEIAPATGRYVKAADLEIFIQEFGPADGLDVLLIPGIGGWSGTWPQTTSMLADAGFRVIAIDLPPFGFSQRPEAALYSKQDQAARILGVMDALGLSKAILVAHSSGGGAAVEAAAQLPRRVEALVLVSAALDIAFDGSRAYPSFLVDRFLAAHRLREGSVAAFLTNPLFTRDLLKKLSHTRGAATDAWVALYQQPLKIKGTTAAVNAWLPQWIANSHVTRSEDPATYRQLNLPIHLIWGDFDAAAPLKQAQELARVASNITLKVIYGAGHLPQIEEPQRFNETLLKSLNVIKYDLEQKSTNSANATNAAGAPAATTSSPTQ